MLDHLVFAQLSAAEVAGQIPDAGHLAANVNGTPADADDFFVYNTTTGILSYDADGNGAGVAIAFATLYGQPTLTAADFTII